MNLHDLLGKTNRFVMSAICLALAGAQSLAQDWTQWGGPRRDFKCESTGLKNRWASGGPPRLWSRPLGQGHSAIIVESNRLYTMYRQGQQETIIALDARSGKTIWERGYSAPYYKGMDMSYGDGPHATPLVAGSLLYTVGSTGKLFCLDKSTGEIRWGHELWPGPQGEINVGYSSSPLLYQNTLIVQAGGSGRSLMAFELNSGRVVWQALNFKTSNSSPILINVDGQEQLVSFMRHEIIGVDPRNGTLFWSHPITAQWNFHFNISTPVWGPDNLLFAASAYGIGGRMLQLNRSNNKTIVKELWQSERTRIHKENAILLGDVIYASTGHLGPAFFTAIEAKTGKVLWQDRRFSHASFLYADGKFIILDEDGQLGLATPTPSGLTLHSQVEILSGRSWTVPTLAGRILYLRDRRNILALPL
jgi:outer membrane protein assembly factor BamB